MVKKFKLDLNYKVIVENWWVWFDYVIEDDIECGVVLMGLEVKSLCNGGFNIVESYVEVKDGEFWFVNFYIVLYDWVMFVYLEWCCCKFLVSKCEFVCFWNEIQCKGMIIVLIVMYFNYKGYVKLKVGIVKGKKLYDKCVIEVKCDWGCQKQCFLWYGD